MRVTKHCSTHEIMAADRLNLRWQLALQKIIVREFSQRLNKSLDEVWTAQNHRRPREVFAEGRRDENQEAVTMDPT